MLSVKRPTGIYRGDGSGLSWPNSPTGSGVMRDIFGPRLFPAHVATVGYNYDYHRGIDLEMVTSSIIYSPMNGAINRFHYTHFGWQDFGQMSQWSKFDPSSSVTFVFASGTLGMTGSRVGAVDFPGGIGRFESTYERICPAADDWLIQLQVSSPFSLAAGSVGVGVFNRSLGESISMDYDGSTFTLHGSDSLGNLIQNGTTLSSASSGQTWMMVSYTGSTNMISWQRSTDNVSWTTIATESNRTFSTSKSPVMIPTLYWRSTDSNASTVTAASVNLNWMDLSQTVARFGNWITIQGVAQKTVLLHFQTLDVRRGQFVAAGQQLGRVGQTGFDARSGPILTEHVHMEYAPNNSYFYSKDESVNPLDPGILPRINISTNVIAARSSGTVNDPLGLGSWRLDVTCSRADNDFDVNLIALTGNVGSRGIVFDSRSGLASDNDVPTNNGVYIVPVTFTTASSFTLSVYFNTSSVGSSFTAFQVQDVSGNLLASG